MRLYLLLIAWLYANEFVEAPTSEVNFEFQSPISDFGYVYGQGIVNLNESDGKLTVKLTQFQSLFNRRLDFTLKLIWKELSNPIYQSCTNMTNDACIVYLYFGDEGTGTVSLETNPGKGQIALLIQIDFRIWKFDYDPCKREEYPRQCVCPTTGNQSTSCLSGIRPTPCFNIDLQTKFIPKELSIYSVAAVKFVFETSFILSSEWINTYVYDYGIYTFYTLTYRKSTDESRPSNSSIFALDIIIGMTGVDYIKDVYKSNYIITNFNLRSFANVVVFNNAFCSKNGSFITCLCCEQSERDDICKSKVRDKEIDTYATTFVQDYGYVMLKAKTWIDANQQFMIDLRDGIEEYFSEKSTYYIESTNETNVVETSQCYYPNSEDQCSLNMTKEIVTVTFQICIEKECKVLASIPIYEQQIDTTDFIDGCSITQLNDTAYCNCLHDIDAENVTGCIIEPTNCNFSFDEVNSFNVDLRIEYVRLPLTGNKIITAFNEKSNKDYVLKLSPINPMPKDHPKQDDYWIAKVWISSTETIKDVPASYRNNISFNVIPSSRMFMHFSQAFCHSNGNIKNFTCFCCDNSTNTKCFTSEEYTFHFSKRSVIFGYVFGSGRVWTTDKKLYVIVDTIYPLISRDEYIYLKTNGKDSQCYFNDVCEIDVESGNNSVSLLYTVSDYKLEEVVRFNLFGGEIQLNNSDQCETVEPGSGDDYKACICPSDYLPDSNCVLDKPIQCTQLSINSTSEYDRPVISFKTYQNSQRPVMEEKGVTRYIEADSRYFKLYWIAVHKLEPIHPSNDSIFLLNISIVEINKPREIIYPATLNFNPENSLYIFEQAYCITKTFDPIMDQITVECFCCDNYSESKSTICMKAPTNSELNIEFSTIFTNYGYLFTRGQLLLDSRQLFTFKRTEINNGFDNAIQLNFIFGRGEEADRKVCNDLTDCRFRFKYQLKSNDVIKLNVSLLGANNEELSVTYIDNFIIGNNSTIQSTANCIAGGHDSTTKFCICPKGKEFDPKTCREVEPTYCQNITPKSTNINGYPRKNAAFFVTLTHGIVDNQYVYVKALNGYYYTFSYSNCKSTSSPNCMIKIGPTGSKQLATSTNNKIEMNFDASSNMVVFEDIQCNVTSTTFSCECCKTEECNQITTVSSTAITQTNTKQSTPKLQPAKPTTQPPAKKPSNTAAIYLGVLIPVILLLLCVVGYLYWRYRKRIEEEKQLIPGYINNQRSNGIRAIKVSDDPWEMERDDVVIQYDNKLGSGAFGDVYLGQIIGDAAIKRVYDDVLCLKRFRDCEIAVKILPPFAAKTAKDDFQNEINFMKTLKYHLHLVCLLGYVNDSRPLLLIEYCKNGDLLQYIRERKLQISLGKEEEMKTRDLISIAWQISNGLEYLASLDFVHRDIAARNVLLDKDNICKISDFGLCRLSDNSLYDTKNEKLPARWLSPESFNSHEYSMKTDVWSYGVLLFELFSLGDVPYAELENSDILKFLEDGNRLNKPSYATDEVYEVMTNCWQSNPDDRRSFAEICHKFLTIMESSNIFYNYIDASVQLEFRDINERDCEVAMDENQVEDDQVDTINT